MIFASMNFALHFDSSVFIRVHLWINFLRFPQSCAKQSAATELLQNNIE